MSLQVSVAGLRSSSMGLSSGFMEPIGGNNDPNQIIFKDNFNNDSAILNRMPQIGTKWYTSGANAALLAAASGRMKQTAAGTPGTTVGYAKTVLSAIPRKIVGKFVWGSGNQPPVFGLWPDSGAGVEPDFSVVAKLVHIYLASNGFGPQLGNQAYFGDTLANHPFAWRGPDSVFALNQGQPYTLEAWIDSTLKWLFMRLFDSGNSLIGQSQSYDPLMAATIGKAFFAETFDDQMQYDDIEIQGLGAMNVPVLNPNLDSSFQTGLDGLAVSLFPGGTVTRNGPGDVTITTNTQPGAGARLDLGACAVGDKVRGCVDVISINGPMQLGLIPTAADGGAISNVVNFNAAGRIVIDAVCSTANGAGSFAIVGTGQAVTARIKYAFVKKYTNAFGFVNP